MKKNFTKILRLNAFGPMVGSGGGQTIEGIFEKIINLGKNYIIPLFLAMVTVYFLWGVVQYIMALPSGDTKKIEAGKQHMIYGIIGMAIMISAWALVRIIVNFVLGPGVETGVPEGPIR